MNSEPNLNLLFINLAYHLYPSKNLLSDFLYTLGVLSICEKAKFPSFTLSAHLILNVIHFWNLPVFFYIRSSMFHYNVILRSKYSTSGSCSAVLIPPWKTASAFKLFFILCKTPSLPVP